MEYTMTEQMQKEQAEALKMLTDSITQMEDANKQRKDVSDLVMSRLHLEIVHLSTSRENWQIIAGVFLLILLLDLFIRR